MISPWLGAPGDAVTLYPHPLLLSLTNPFSRYPSMLHGGQKMTVRGCICVLSRFSLCDPQTVARQAPLSPGFSRPGHCSRLPCPPPGGLPDPGFEVGRGTALSYLGINLPHSGFSAGILTSDLQFSSVVKVLPFIAEEASNRPIATQPVSDKAGA